MITYKDILVNSFAYGYKYYMAHIYFYMSWSWIFADDIGNPTKIREQRESQNVIIAIEKGANR